MRVFVLCTGRCGSKTLSKACSHIENFTSGHETNALRKLGKARFSYPENHIEIDNRLSWFLGRLDEEFGTEPFFVHLIRNPDEVAVSFDKRWANKHGITNAYARGILMGVKTDVSTCRDYVHTVNSNIRLFLRDKPNKMEILMDKFEKDFTKFWNRIEAQGNLESALRELSVCHNRSKR